MYKIKRMSIDYFAVTTFCSGRLGLPFGVWTFCRTRAIDYKRRPHVAVILANGKRVHFSIEDEPKNMGGGRKLISPEDYELIISWIQLNKQVLLDHWEGRVDSYGLCEQLIKIKTKKRIWERKTEDVECNT